jgi:hypothetical protein
LYDQTPQYTLTRNQPITVASLFSTGTACRCGITTEGTRLQEVILNPDDFDPLRARTSSIIATHETVHLATPRSKNNEPLWQPQLEEILGAKFPEVQKHMYKVAK